MDTLHVPMNPPTLTPTSDTHSPTLPRTTPTPYSPSFTDPTLLQRLLHRPPPPTTPPQTPTPTAPSLDPLPLTAPPSQTPLLQSLLHRSTPSPYSPSYSSSIDPPTAPPAAPPAAPPEAPPEALRKPNPKRRLAGLPSDRRGATGGRSRDSMAVFLCVSRRRRVRRGCAAAAAAAAGGGGPGRWSRAPPLRLFGPLKP
nr:extensin-like [Penaeus vannamei]